MSEEEKKISNCSTCARYSKIAYFCLELKKWIFPEDIVEEAQCESYSGKEDEHVCKDS